MSRRLSAPSLAALSVAAFLASLSLVAWRQGRALEVFAHLDRVRSEQALALAERRALTTRLQELESRGFVTREAVRRLGMIQPADSSIVLLDNEMR